MGYPNPNESPYDLFMTGHAGSSVSTMLGLASGDELMGHDDRHAVAVIGDGAFPSGIVFEALNNAGDEARSCSLCSTTTRCRSARASAAWPNISIACG